MEKVLPSEITWRRDKIGFEPPQKNWMQNTSVKELIIEAKKKLMNEKILDPSVMKREIIPLAAHDADNFDWRYLSASILFK